VDGTVGGTGLEAKDAQLMRTPIGPWSVPELFISDTETVCADAQANISRAGSRTLQLMLLSSVPGGSGELPLSTGTYDVGSAAGVFCLGSGDCDFDALVVLVSLDAGCNLAPTGPVSQVADSGTVTVEAVGALEVTGTFTARFGSEELTGTFAAATCTPTGALPAPTCQ
jgi:hypothetical protein